MSRLGKTRPSSDLWREVWKHRHFYLFVSPFVILFAVFGLYPLLYSFGLSFMKWDGLSAKTWVGLGNFVTMLDDEVLLTSIWNTLAIGILYIPPMMVLAFLFALALNSSWLKARAFFRGDVLPALRYAHGGYLHSIPAAVQSGARLAELWNPPDERRHAFPAPECDTVAYK